MLSGNEVIHNLAYFLIELNSESFVSGGSTGACVGEEHRAHNPEYGPAETGSAPAKCECRLHSVLLIITGSNFCIEMQL